MTLQHRRPVLFYGSVFFALTLASFAAMLWHELNTEAGALVRAYVAADRGRFDEVPKILEPLKERVLFRIRRHIAAEHPLVPFLEGISRGAFGKYNEASAYFLSAERICRSQWWARWNFGEKRCDLLRAESYFRAGDMVVKRWSDFSYSEAISLYAKGLLLQPDNRISKKALDALMYGRERAKKETESKDGKGNLPFDRLPGLYDLPQKGGSPGEKERKGY